MASEVDLDTQPCADRRESCDENRQLRPDTGHRQAFMIAFVTNIVERWLVEISHALGLARSILRCLDCATRPKPCDKEGLPVCLKRFRRRVKE